MNKPIPAKMGAAEVLAYGYLLPCRESAAEIAAKSPVPDMDAHTVEAFAFGALEDATVPFFAAWATAHKKAVAAIERRLKAVAKREGGEA